MPSASTLPHLENRSPADLIPYDRNPRKNDSAVDAVAASITEFGFQSPIIVDAEGVIIAGHTRHKAALKLGLDAVPVIVAGLTPEKARALRLADNRVGEIAEWDANALAAEIEAAQADLTPYGFEVSEASVDDFGDEFSLPDGDAPEVSIITITLAPEQRDLILSVLDSVDVDDVPTFGNANRRGNALYKVVAFA